MAKELDKNDHLILEKLLKTGDPYIILSSSMSDSKSEIKNKYNDIMEKGVGTFTKEEIERIENAYQLLSTDKYRNAFDTFVVMQQQRDKNLSDNLTTLSTQLRSLACKIASIPLLNMQLIFNSPNNISIEQSKTIIKSLYQLNGLSGLYRGMVFSISSLSIEVIRIFFLEINYLMYLKFLNDKKAPKSVLDKIGTFSSFFTGYPSKLILDCLVLAPLNITLIQVIKNIVSKKPYYGALYAIPLLVLNKEIRELVDKCSNKIKQYAKIDGNGKDHDEESGQANQVGSFVKYSAIILINPITTSIIKSLLCSPLNAIYATYPTAMINAYVSGSLLPIAMNPFTIASNAYNTFGVSYFFRGFAPTLAFRILDTIGKSYDPNSQEAIFE